MRAVLLLILLLAAGPAWACELPAGAVKVVGERTSLGLQPRPAPIPVHASFALDLTFCPQVPDKIVVDAHMPAHRHGMNYRPSVARTGEGWRAEGLLFHMPGEWEFVFDLTREDGGRERLTHRVTLR